MEMRNYCHLDSTTEKSYIDRKANYVILQTRIQI